MLGAAAVTGVGTNGVAGTLHVASSDCANAITSSLAVGGDTLSVGCSAGTVTGTGAGVGVGVGASISDLANFFGLACGTGGAVVNSASGEGGAGYTTVIIAGSAETGRSISAVGAGSTAGAGAGSSITRS
jgi:hypothetical protein